jgi:16S rRNA (guanine527-N7)-methyltransferase
MAAAGNLAAEPLAVGTQELGLALSAAQMDALLRFADLLGRWGGVFNLSAVRDPAAVVSHHLLDSLAVVLPLDRWSGGQPIRLLDVGSGAGLPGVPLAIARPTWSITTIDAVAKKAAFVRQAAGELGLTNLRALHGRVGGRVAEPVAAFDVVISRAFSSLEGLVTSTSAQRAPEGVWVAMKGRVPREEIESLPSVVEVFHVEQLAVPGLDAARCLVWMRPH